MLFNRAIDSGSLGKASITGRALYPFLVRLADNTNRFVIRNAGLARLTKVSRLSRNSVRDGLQSLVEVGLLRKVSAGRPGLSKGMANIASTYQMIAPDLPAELGLPADEHPYAVLGHTPVSPEDIGADHPAVYRGAVTGTGGVPRGARKKRTALKNSIKKGAVEELGQGAARLIEFGVARDAAILLAAKRDLQTVEDQIENARTKPGVEDPVAYCVAALTNGWRVPDRIVTRRRARRGDVARTERVDAQIAERAVERQVVAATDANVDAWIADTDPTEVEATYTHWRETLPPSLRNRGRTMPPAESRAFRAYVAELLHS